MTHTVPKNRHEKVSEDPPTPAISSAHVRSTVIAVQKQPRKILTPDPKITSESNRKDQVYGIENVLKEDLELERRKKPSFQKPIEKRSVKNLSHRSIFGLHKDRCPKGTVPILRTTKKDLIEEKNSLTSSIFLEDIPGVHVAEIAISSKFGPYYSIFGMNSVYNPRVTAKGQMSLSHMWVQNGPVDTNNKISIGWHVCPELYGDQDSHVYTSWTRDNYRKTGCYNIRCPGFVQIHKNMYPGARLKNVSSYGGPVFGFDSSITQDPVTKNWWIGEKGHFMGYFPAKLFSNMNSADKVGFGGRTLTPKGSPSPPMGSGHFPDENFYHASFYKWINVENLTRDFGPEKYQIENYIDHPKCFGVSYYGKLQKKFGYTLQFGGPGGNCGN
ncbi:hypothetical protein PHAVU_008G228600 [Phaseolus vulgaris]|uniref:Neprosin PEP catalytic domain-containing protein n=1 Tax=Phaseolus vulgaris TaxID=3885 RepID=V7BBG8_PHAVU|nr:hypothetical protein PHAVU_008G228600g [Phaseolus vulgaris]ESW13816.1 hypothetical protein PHAVU_008G228600g [Phaseolus vulgaris]